MFGSTRTTTCCSFLFAIFYLGGFSANAATPLVDFPIGYSSNGGTYGFIGLIQQQHLLEQQGIDVTPLQADMETLAAAGQPPVLAAFVILRESPCHYLRMSAWLIMPGHRA